MSRFDEEPDADPHGECAAEIHRLQAQVEALTAENAQIRELMNLYNLGGWTDSLTLMQERDNLINLLENSWQGWFPAVHDGAGFDRHEFVFKSSERDLRIAIKGTA